MKPILPILVVGLLLTCTVVPAQAVQWTPIVPQRDQSPYLMNLNQFFPGGMIEGIPSTIPVYQLGGTITGPSCQNPGFIFNFQQYVITMAQLKSYVLSEIQAAMQAAPLLLVESLFPELADVLKHLNNMSWLKLTLDHHTCATLMNELRKANMVPSLRPYSQCVQQQMNGGADKDTAESNCSATVSLVYNFLKQSNVPSFNLVGELISFAQSQRDQQKNLEVPSDATLQQIQQLLGEITVSQDGRTVNPGVPVRTVYKNLKIATTLALQSLVSNCMAQIGPNQDTCQILDSDLAAFQSELTVVFPQTDGPYPLIQPDLIRALASEPPSKQGDLENLLAHKVVMVRLHQIVHSAGYITRLVRNFDGAGEYDFSVKNAVANIEDQLDHIEFDQQDRNDLARSYTDIMNIISAGQALQTQEATSPTKPRTPTAFPLSR